MSSSSPPASGELNEAGFLAFGTALKAVNGEVEAGSAALGGSLCDCGGRRLKAVKGGAGSDAAGSATLGGSLWDCGGRRLTTCRRDPPPPEPLLLVREGSNLEASDSRNL